MEEKKYIQLQNSNDVLRLWILTKDGKETGEYLEFDMEDIDLISNVEKMHEEDKKNNQWANNQIEIIKKKQDFVKKGEKISNNQKMQYEVIKKYFKRQKEIYDIFLGEGGVDKLLYGRKFEWGTMEEIQQLIEKQILPQLQITKDNIINKIKNKYKQSNEKNVLK